MKMYGINIVSCGRDWKDDITTEGDVHLTDDGLLTVCYTLDGDECTLTVDGGKVVQRRRGVQNVHIEFEEGKYTDCTFGNGGFTGAYKIFTDKIKLIRSKAGMRLSLDYLSGDDREPVKLKFTALNKSWGTK